MTHLTSDQLIDAIDGTLAPAHRAHLTTCDACRAQLDVLTATLSEAKHSTIPEPSPLFWQQFSRRVNESIDASRSTRGWPQWLRWQIALPFGAVAMIVFALMMALPRQTRIAMTNADMSVPATAEDTWASFADLVGDLDVDLASEAGVIEPGVADQAVFHLTAEERLELSRLLHAELARAKS